MNDLVLAGESVLVAFEGGCGGSEEDGAFLKAAADNGEVAGVVLGWVFLLVSWFVFFIDNDESEIGKRGEDGRASSDNDTCFSGPDTVPFVEAFALGKVGVKNGNFIDHFREAGFEALDGLGGEGDFGNKNNDILAEVECLLGGLKIDFGFSRSCDAVEKDGVWWLFAIEAFGDGLEDFVLLWVEGKRLGGDEGFPGVGVASDFEIDEFNPAFFGE